MDIQGFYKVSEAQVYISPVAGEKTKVLKDGAGLLHYLRVCNTTNAKRYVFVFDNNAASGAALVMPPIVVPPNDQVTIQSFAFPFDVGCTVSSSTTQTSYTAGGNNDLQIHAITK